MQILSLQLIIKLIISTFESFITILILSSLRFFLKSISYQPVTQVSSCIPLLLDSKSIFKLIQELIHFVKPIDPNLIFCV